MNLQMVNFNTVVELLNINGSALLPLLNLSLKFNAPMMSFWNFDPSVGVYGMCEILMHCINSVLEDSGDHTGQLILIAHITTHTNQSWFFPLYLLHSFDQVFTGATGLWLSGEQFMRSMNFLKLWTLMDEIWTSILSQLLNLGTAATSAKMSVSICLLNKM